MLIPSHPEMLWRVLIKWSRPRSYQEVIAQTKATSDDESARFYMILAKRGRRTEVGYIGKTYDSEVWRRLHSRDHVRRFRRLKQKFRKAVFLVSHGSIDIHRWHPINGRYPSRKRIDDIETLLILSSSRMSRILNLRKHKSHGITDHYELINQGAYHPLPRRVVLTVATSIT